MKLRLVSDFRDYYDHWFDLEGEPFERLSTAGMSRPEMLAYMDTDYNLSTPQHGRVSELAQHGYPLVVYTDERSHRGDGKQVMLPWDAQAQYPDAYAARYYGGLTLCPIIANYPDAQHSHAEQKCQSSTLRILCVGSRTWVLGYWSDTDWRSNWGDGGVEVLEETTSWGVHQRLRERINRPMWAIDTILTHEWKELAVDFNISPGLKGTGIEEVLPSREVVDLLKDAVEYHAAPCTIQTRATSG